MRPNPAVLASSDTFFITFLASFLIWFMLAGLVVLWVIDGKIKKEEALHAFIATLVAWLITEMLKSFIPSQRPFVTQELVPLTITIPGIASFPSGHSAAAFATATTVWLHEKRSGYYFLVLAVLVALGRILSNVHTVTDVLGGASIGVLTSYFLERMHVERLLRR